MARLLAYMQENCNLCGDSKFFDVGHGMGRPVFHTALLQPPVGQTFGTEFNPELYHQSMLVLRELADRVPLLRSTPRVFLMDSNIKDIVSLNP